MGQFSDLVSSFEEKISFWCSVSVRRIMDLYAHHRLSEIQTHEFVGILEVGSCYILFWRHKRTKKYSMERRMNHFRNWTRKKNRHLHKRKWSATPKIDVESELYFLKIEYSSLEKKIYDQLIKWVVITLDSRSDVAFRIFLRYSFQFFVATQIWLTVPAAQHIFNREIDSLD